MENCNLLHVGIIGCGVIARDHLGAIKDSCGPIELHLCDQNIEAAREFKNGFDCNVRIHTDASKMLSEEKFDAVHILTPPNSHYDIAKNAIDNGANVFIEKPMALSRQETEQLYELGKIKGKMVCVGHSLLYMDCVLKATKLLHSGKMGRIIGVHSFFGHSEKKKSISYGGVSHWAYKTPGGPLINLISHPASVIVELLGMPETINILADARNLMPNGFSDLLDITIRTSNGHGSFTVSMAHGSSSRYVDIECEKGSIHVDFSRQIMVSKYHKGKFGPLSKKFGGIGLGISFIRSTFGVIYKIATGKMKSNPGTRELVVRFYQAIRNGGNCPVSKENAIGVAMILEKIIAESEAAKVNQDI